MEAQKARNLHAFWALVNNYLFERPFSGNASALEAQQACNLYGFWASVKKKVSEKGFFLALPRPWTRQTARNLRAFPGLGKNYFSEGLFFWHCLGLGSAKRLVIYMLFRASVKVLLLKGLFLALFRPAPEEPDPNR